MSSIRIKAKDRKGLVDVKCLMKHNMETADRIGALICGHPLWLSSALSKLHYSAAKVDNEPAEANPQTAHMFIVNPIHAQAIDGLFSTHPAMENRIARLEELATEMGISSPRVSPWA